MKSKNDFNLSEANEWLLEMDIDKVNELYKKYEQHLLEMDSKEIVQYLYDEEHKKETEYNFKNLIN